MLQETMPVRDQELDLEASLLARIQCSTRLSQFWSLAVKMLRSNARVQMFNSEELAMEIQCQWMMMKKSQHNLNVLARL